MSKYLTLIPLLREMCFPYYHSCLEKKMTMILGNWNFYVFSFGKSSKCDLGSDHETTHSPFSKGGKFLSFPILHMSSSIYSLSCIYSFLLCMAGCMSPYHMETAASIHPPCFIFYLFYIYFCLYGWRQDGSHFIWQAPLTHPPATFVRFLFLHSKHTPPSIFLFFLNVIVKCSSEMTLNMCTLTEGIHLVIYFLLPVSCGLFIVSVYFDFIQSLKHPWKLSRFGIIK